MTLFWHKCHGRNAKQRTCFGLSKLVGGKIILNMFEINYSLLIQYEKLEKLHHGKIQCVESIFDVIYAIICFIGLTPGFKKLKVMQYKHVKIWIEITSKMDSTRWILPWCNLCQKSVILIKMCNKFKSKICQEFSVKNWKLSLKKTCGQSQYEFKWKC